MRSLLFLPLGLLALTGSACGGDDGPCPVCAARAAEARARARPEGPHGGTIVAASDRSAFFEIVHDGAALRTELYLFDADMKPLAATDVPVLNVVRHGKTTALDGDGEADHWTFSSWLLGMEPHGRFRVEVGDLTYVPLFTHTHAESTGHGHDTPASHGPDAAGDDDDQLDEDDE